MCGFVSDSEENTMQDPEDIKKARALSYMEQ